MNPLRVLSLGAGVQSSTLLLMADAGEFEERPECAIFADTGWEPHAVYDWLEWLEAHVSIPIRRVNNGNIRQALTAPVGSRQRYASVPFFLANGTVRGGLGRRQCTNEYKLVPIRREYRRLLGVGPRERIPAARVEAWIGINLDEAHRMKPSRERFVINRYPLIDRRMTRHDCLRWLAARGVPTPPKSACIGCPYRGDSGWRKMRTEDPQAFADACTVDEILRSSGTQKEKGLRFQQFIHRALIPLSEVDLRTDEERGQGDLFGNECEGMCGI